MPYPAGFHRLVMIYNVYGDTCNTTLSIVPGLSGTMPAVTQALCDDVADFIASWWPNSGGSTIKGMAISNSAQLTAIKLNRISAAGLYADPDTIEHVYTTPVAGGPGVLAPAQLSIVATLRGDEERARAGKGRMYTPLSQGTIVGIGSDGRLTEANALIVADGIATLINGINDCYIAASVNAVAGIASKAGSGAFQAVSKVTVGRVVDTMRSRRSKLAEDYVTSSLL